MSSAYKAQYSTNIIILINGIHLLKLQPRNSKILSMETNKPPEVSQFHLFWAAHVGWEELPWDSLSHSTDGW